MGGAIDVLAPTIVLLRLPDYFLWVWMFQVKIAAEAE
jgi:hypothetical protein